MILNHLIPKVFQCTSRSDCKYALLNFSIGYRLSISKNNRDFNNDVKHGGTINNQKPHRLVRQNYY